MCLLSLHLTSDQLAKAITLYNNKIHKEAAHIQISDNSREFHQSRRFVFHQNRNKSKKPKNKTNEKVQSKDKEHEARKIRNEELEKIELKVQKRVQEEEEMILRSPNPECVTETLVKS